MKSLIIAVGLCCMIVTGCSAMTIDCPAYIEGLYEEVDIIEKFKGDIQSGTVKSIHSK